MGTLWDSMIDGYNNPGGVPMPAEEPSQSAPAQSAWDTLMNAHTPPKDERKVVDEDYIVSGLVERGLPEHIAQGFAMNMMDESGLDSGINEVSPLVEGSRGGFGLYQLTGPRRRQYEKFAEDRGVSPANTDAQLDFLMWELENTEKSAAQDIMNTSSAGEAGAAIVNRFLRPAAEHREKRASKYLAGGVTPKPRPNKLWLDF